MSSTPENQDLGTIVRICVGRYARLSCILFESKHRQDERAGLYTEITNP